MLLVLLALLGVSQVQASTVGLDPEAQKILQEMEPQTAVEIPAVTAVAATNSVSTTATSTSPAATTVAAAALSESEIPLQLEKPKVAEAGTQAGSRLFAGIGILLLMVGGGVYLIRRNARPGPRQNAPQIKVLTQHWLGPKKSLAIVRVAGESILIGVTDQSINLIKPLALLDEELPEITPQDFAQEMKTQDRDASIPSSTATASEGEDFAFGALHQIRDRVSRKLQNMRNFD